MVAFVISQAIVAGGLATGLVVMIVVSLMTKKPDAATQKMVDDTRIPTGKAILGKQH